MCPRAAQLLPGRWRARSARPIATGLYWGRPVPGFGDPDGPRPDPRPGAGGARRQPHRPRVHRRRRRRLGRLPDGGPAPRRAGQPPTSQRPDDGLALRGVYIAAAVRCAPPANKPTPDEVRACLAHLEAELAHLPRLDTVVALGKIAWDAWLQLRRPPRHAAPPAPGVRPRRGGRLAGSRRHRAPSIGRPAHSPRLIGCYHPSRQNTNTGRSRRRCTTMCSAVCWEACVDARIPLSFAESRLPPDMMHQTRCSAERRLRCLIATASRYPTRPEIMQVSRAQRACERAAQRSRSGTVRSGRSVMRPSTPHSSSRTPRPRRPPPTPAPRSPCGAPAGRTPAT